MVKTRNQTRNLDQQYKYILPAKGASKISKRRTSKAKDNASATTEPVRKQTISQEQIKKLIDFIVIKKMSVRIASNRVNIGYSAGYFYYNLYKNDPDQKIPLPRNAASEERTKMSIGFIVNDKVASISGWQEPEIMPIRSHRCGYISRKYTQEQITNLIGHIVDDNMSIPDASKKVNVSRDIGRKYYQQYLDDPDHKIPKVKSKSGDGKPCTQEQINALISYIVDDGMTVPAAARQASMSVCSGRKYYQLYTDDPERRIPIQTRKVCSGNGFSQEQIDVLIRYIVEDKMTLKAASIKANMSKGTAGKYYRRYIKNPHIDLIDKGMGGSGHVCTQDKIKQVIGYIIDDNMSIDVAAWKAKVSPGAARKYYRIYMEDPNHKMPAPHDSIPAGRPSTQDQIRNLITYIVDDKMSIETASAKANMSETAGRRYYRAYWNDPNHAIPAPGKTSAQSHCTQDQIKELIHFIVDDEMTMKAASTKAGMSEVTGRKYYRQYLGDPHRTIPSPGRIKKSGASFSTQD
ncbi:hypothetical protein K501DRAFT_282090 [Backusella circina FSU 941]|nr:hypothetical protein K501DRAFT_282090 [Backusella circina FSU 941]